jgi:hypothetical protein
MMASMNELQGQIGEVRMTIHIKRAATGETETHELIGKVMDEVKDEVKEDSDGSYS